MRPPSRSGHAAVEARGNELERPFGFGVVRQLFEPALVGGDVDDLLSGAARFVASVLDIETRATSRQAPGDTFALHNGIYWLTANLAARQPLAILVDDLHWSDDESVEALAHLGNRLEGIPVALIAASRIEESRSGLEALRRSSGRTRPPAPPEAARPGCRERDRPLVGPRRRRRALRRLPRGIGRQPVPPRGAGPLAGRGRIRGSGRRPRREPRAGHPRAERPAGRGCPPPPAPSLAAAAVLGDAAPAASCCGARRTARRRSRGGGRLAGRGRDPSPSLARSSSSTHWSGRASTRESGPRRARASTHGRRG